MGPRGHRGPTGPTGATGPPGGLAGIADFYALMPPDNAFRVAPGEDVQFPQDGPARNGDILRAGPGAFTLRTVGTYEVVFQVSVRDSGQLVLTLNGIELPHTVVGRATGTSQIMGISLVETTVNDSVLTVRNPVNNATPLAITSHAGGTEPVSAHLVVTRIR